MRRLPLALAVAAPLLASCQPAQAQDIPVARFAGFAVNAEPARDLASPIVLPASRAPLWSPEADIVAEPVTSPEFSGQATLDWSGLGEGDVAGLALRHDADHWVSIQVERIEPADLIAVRLHDGPGGTTAGRLVYTTALGGSFNRKVRLRIDAHGGSARLMFAEQHGLWQILAEDVPLPRASSASPALVLFATDGADPAPDPED